MGLIRKTLMVGTLGVVNGSSKKQRVAKATLDAVLREETRELEMGAALDRAITDAILAERRRGSDHARHYETDPVYRHWCDTHPTSTGLED
jgi:hypothetical protein